VQFHPQPNLGIPRRVRFAAALILLLGGCASTSTPRTPADTFLAQVRGLCGKAFEGRIASPPVPSDAAFAGKRLVMHVRDCTADAVRIPFHVGEDRSRTWVITPISTGLRLKHDHRHEDGSEDVLTQYGGDTVGAGSAVRQEFPVDQFSKDLFNRQNAAVSTTNVWAMEVHPGRTFAYELRRPGRHFRVEFDLTRPVTPPPAPWGAR
jgi:hypothetical protein